MQSEYKGISLGDKLLSLMDHLAAHNDAQGLELLRATFAELTLNGIVDTRTSFIDLAEYCELLADAIRRGADINADESITNLRQLINKDLAK